MFQQRTALLLLFISNYTRGISLLFSNTVTRKLARRIHNALARMLSSWSCICSPPSNRKPMLIRETLVEIESWRSNDPLPDETQDRIRELIADAQCAIDGFDREIEAIKDRCQQSIARRATLRAAVSSVKLLPPEILMKMFAAYMAINPVLSLPPWRGDGPWKLGHVSYKWRRALLCASELWKNIEFRTPYYPNPTHFEMNLVESCRDVLSRQNSLITLSIQLLQSLQPRSAVALAASFNHRLQSLSIMNLNHEDLRLLLELPAGSFASLETLKFQFAHLLPLLLLVRTSSFQSTPSLQSVEYTAVEPLENDECLHHLLLLPWSWLTTFRMSRIWILGFCITTTGITKNRILRSYEHIWA